MAPNENNPGRLVSALPQPSRLQSPKRHLTDITDSAHNARFMLPPPAPGTKRKTLIERGGEPTPRNAPAPPQSRPYVSTVKGTSILGASRQNSFSSSVSAPRPASSSSHRSTSNSSFASSVSSIRPPSAQSYRPHTSMSYHTKSKSMYSRPATSLEDRPNNVRDGQSEGPSNSMTKPFSSASLRTCSANTSRRKMPVLNKDGQSDNTTYWSSSTAGPANQKIPVQSLRDFSLSTALNKLTLDPAPPIFLASPQESGESRKLASPSTPSLIPIRKPSVPTLRPLASPTKAPRKTPTPARYLTKDSDERVTDWDLGSRVDNMESMYAELKSTLSSTTTESNGLKENIAIYKARINELEDMKIELIRDNACLRTDLEGLRTEISASSFALEEATRKHSHELSDFVQKIHDAKRAHVNEIDDLQRQLRRDVNHAIHDAEEETRRIERNHRDEVADVKRQLEEVIDHEREQRKKEVQALSSEGSMAQERVENELESREKALLLLTDELEQAKNEIVREKDSNRNIRAKFDEAANNAIITESSMRSLKARIEFLESDCKSQSQSFADLEQRTQDAIREADEAKSKLRTEETLRRKLHNQVQELKGNIRVFCRVRPTLGEETDQARILFPDASEDSRELEVFGQEEKSSLGTITTKKNSFSFDRVFTPVSQNAAVFDEISQLVQSALDGYNVCIFCYGQTGSGKTHTMSSEDGMIPRAVNQIYNSAHSLEEKGWKYTMEGSFVEVYNENINDLLGKAEDFDKKKHEIRHDMQKCKTTITDINIVDLDSPGRVESVLRKAMNNRSVAATKANERSSRSHSVFILKLNGQNSITGEKSEGTLNLVDLAGSERLSHSGATGERLKETQNINKSLSCLGDVIGALGQGKDGGHIPYRNSKLTYLLQFSLGGNSKTLMFVMVSPLQAHFNETVTSLKFATKVHNTHIGTAKRQAKVRE